MSPVDKDTMSYFLTSLAERVPLPAPGFPNMTILNTPPSLPDLPDSSLALAALRNSVREGTVEGIDLPTLNTAGRRCLGDHWEGDISMGEGGKGRGERDPSQATRANLYGECCNGDWGTEFGHPAMIAPVMACREII